VRLRRFLSIPTVLVGFLGSASTSFETQIDREVPTKVNELILRAASDKILRLLELSWMYSHRLPLSWTQFAILNPRMVTGYEKRFGDIRAPGIEASPDRLPSGGEDAGSLTDGCQAVSRVDLVLLEFAVAQEG